MSGGQRAIRKRYTLPLGIVFVVVFTLVGQFLEFHGWFTGAESRITHFLLATPSASSRSLPIAVIEIDDESYDQFFDRVSPLKPPLVWSLIEAIATTFKPAVIGVDLLTEETAYAAYDTFRPIPPTTPVVWATGFKEHPVPQSVNFLEWLWGNDESMRVVPGERTLEEHR